MDYNEMVKIFRRMIDGDVRLNESMKHHTSFRIGGPADVFIIPKHIDDLQRLVKFFHEKKIAYQIIGNGSNLLVADEGVRGVVIKISGCLDYIHHQGNKIIAGAGALLSSVARYALNLGLGGFEFAAGIPGTIGGAIAMNAGAYNYTMSDRVTRVKFLKPDGEIVDYRNGELGFGRRKSRFQKEVGIIIEIEIELFEKPCSEIKKLMDEYSQKRRSNQPLSYPSAGCIFQNPEGGGAGRYIDAAGAKGLRVGDAQVSDIHANFIINLGNATAEDVLTLIDMVQKMVIEKTGVRLEPEVKFIGRVRKD